MTDSTATDKSAKSQHRTWGIGSQLLFSVNGVLLLLVAIFLTYDYQRGMGARLEDKRIALQEEAKTLMPGVLQSQQDGSKSTQQYVDVAGLNLSSLFLPAEEVAGDYFDVITLQDGTHVVCVADVTGHGVRKRLPDSTARWKRSSV